MAEAWLACAACGASYDLGPLTGGCPACRARGLASPLEVAYAPGPPEGPPAPGLWRWAGLLPPVPPHLRVSLGEGGTHLAELRPERGPRLLLKNETRNPTWSWKDRPNAVTASVARWFGFPRLAVVSTGNHGSAAAAYAAAAGLGCTVFCHPDAPATQTDLMAAYGATVRRTGRPDAPVLRLLAGGGVFPGTTLCPRAGFSNPFGVEGFKTIAFELVEQLGGSAPDRVFVPVGSGDGVYGVWKGFRELRAAGRIDRTPRVVACQAAGADSLDRAFRRGDGRVTPLASAETVALSLAELATGDHALRAVAESGGCVRVSADAETLRAATGLARQGYAVEPASAVAYACARAAARGGGGDGETWVVLGTGSAAKWPAGSPAPRAAGAEAPAGGKS